MFDSISSFIDLGGPVVVLLLGLSVFALALILLKFVQFWRESVGAHGPAQEALRVWYQHGYGDARQKLEGDRSAVSQTMATVMRLVSSRSVPRTVIEEEAGRIALTRLHELQKGFRALDAIAQVAPLLGLFGTVIGMIQAFQELQGAGSAVDPSLLAGGIWVALLTTAVGLAVAMPVSLILTWFETRLENERVAIETMTTELLSHHALQKHESSKDGAGQPMMAGAERHAH